MKAHEIFQHASPALIREMLHYLRTEQKEIYRTALATLAQGRKLRPIFVQKKSPEQQYAWLQKTAQLRGADGVDEHLLQIWLLKAHQPLLVAFLDGVGIEHDGEGAADDLPDEIDAAKLKTTVDALLKSHDPEVVRVYLHTFQLQKAGGWDSLTEILANDARLQFGAAATEEKKEAPAPKKAEAPVEEKAEAPAEEKAEAPAEKKAEAPAEEA